MLTARHPTPTWIQGRKQWHSNNMLNVFYAWFEGHNNTWPCQSTTTTEEQERCLVSADMRISLFRVNPHKATGCVINVCTDQLADVLMEILHISWICGPHDRPCPSSVRWRCPQWLVSMTQWISPYSTDSYFDEVLWEAGQETHPHYPSHLTRHHAIFIPPQFLHGQRSWGTHFILSVELLTCQPNCYLNW